MVSPSIVSGFLLVTALLALTLVLYPRVVLRLARRAARERVYSGRAADVSYSIVLVVRNEARTIRRRLRNLLRQQGADQMRELVIVDDASTDGTVAIAKQAIDPAGCIRIVANAGRGKAAGVNRGIAECTGEVIVFCDARQVFERDAIRHLLAPFQSEKVQLAAGSLKFTHWRRAQPQLGYADIYWRHEQALREAEARLGMLHGVAGAIYAVRRVAMPKLPEGLILDDMFVPLAVGQRGGELRFAPDAIAWDLPRPASQGDFVKRRRTIAGNFQLLALQPEYFIFFRNRQLTALFCHKFLRLFVSACTALLGFMLLLHESVQVRTGVGALLAVLILLAIIGGWPRLPCAVRRIASLARGALLLVAATAGALWYVATGRANKLW